MGMDIHMDIVYKGEMIKEDIFDGRNSVWFNKLMGRTHADEYDHLQNRSGYPEDINPDIVVNYGDPYTYFGHGYVKVGDFIDWFEKYNPDLDAGWVSTYDKWKIEKKGYVPDDIPHELPLDANPADMHFVEFSNYWDDSSICVYEYVKEHNIPRDAYIIYCFDC